MHRGTGDCDRTLKGVNGIGLAELNESRITEPGHEELRQSVTNPQDDPRSAALPYYEVPVHGRAALEYGLRLDAMAAKRARWLVNAIDKRDRRRRR